VKFIRIFLLSICCAVSFSASAQLTTVTVDPGPYTPESTIAATFDIDPATCIRPGNTFQLYLSDAFGNFGSEVLIGTYSGFYSTFVNGKIPLGTAPGVGYKLRIKSTDPPGIVSVESNTFVIKAGASVEARIVSNKPITGNAEAFGFCSGAQSGTGADINLINGSTATGTVTATFTNELDQTSSVLPIAPQITFSPQKTHYTMFVKAVMPDGTVATKAYFIINNETITAFSTNGNNVVCLPGALAYLIDVTGTNGIRKNFPGNTYLIDWGDNTTNTYTFCDLQGGTVQHQYTNTSCGKTFTSGSTTIYNAFGINIQMVSAFSCGNIGTAVSTTAKVVTITQTLFSGPLVGCTNANQTFTNNSVLGDDPNNTGPSCKPDNATFNWYVDGMLIPAFAGVSRATQFVYQFTTNGVHTVKLETNSSTPCQSPVATQQICIQNAPTPAFTVPSLVCTNTAVTPVDASVVDINCNNNVTYTWSISPTTGVTPSAAVVTTPAAPPTYNFTQTGIYTISLRITTPTCGASAIVTRTVTVNASPQAVLSPDFEVCALATYNFDTSNSPTKATIAGTTTTLADTYTWTVTPAGTGTYTFVNGTTAASRYPSIKFNSFDEYTVTVVHQNNCGTAATDSQVITFTTAPVVDAGTYPLICYDATNIPLTGSVTGNTADVTGITWSTGGGGTFSPNANTLAATYTPSQTERNSRAINLTLTVNTSLPGTCSSIVSNVTITIKDPVTVSSSATKSICTGAAVGYTPTSATAGATFTWTATGSASATGFSATGNGSINDVITNTDATTNATVTYIITPTGNGCTGTPFTFTVTVNPKPSASAADRLICSGQQAGITLTSNLTNTSYTWTSTATAGVTGNTNNATPTSSNSINDVLTNSGTTSGTATYTITPITNGCSGTPITVTVTVEPPPTTPNAGASKSICNQPTYTLEGNQPTVGTGKWTQVTVFPGITFDDDTKFNAIVSGLQPNNTYIFRWTITGAASCTPKISDVSIKVDPASVGGTTAGSQSVCSGNNSGQITLSGNVGNVVRWESSPDGITWTTIAGQTGTTISYNNLTATTQYRAIVISGSCTSAASSVAIITVNQPVVAANAGTPQVLCNVTTATLNGNSPTPNTGLWTLLSGQAGVTFTDPTLFNTQVNGLVPGQVYTFRWTISGTAPCPQTTSDVTITVDLLSNGGTAGGSTSVCAGNNSGNITLSGQVGNVLRWESSTDGFVTTTTIAATTTSIPYQNLSTTTQYRAVVQNGSCGSALSTVATVTVNQGAVAANAGLDQSLCNLTSTTLAGNSPGPNTGLWTIISGPAGAVITDPSLFNTTVTGLVGGSTYIFRWTISGVAPCPASSDDVSIVNLSPIQANSISSSSSTYCNGQVVTLSGSTPTGGNTTYTYIWESSATGNAPWAVINGQTNRDLTITVSTNMSYRRIVNSGVCSTTSNVLSITVLPSVANNTIASNQTICLNSTPNVITGSQPTGGNGANYIYGWEQSTDGVVWSVVAGANGQNYAPTAITQTTSYRRLVSSGACNGAQQNVSTPVTITVNPNARAEFTWTNDTGCIPFVIDANNIKAVAYPDRNNTYTWYVNGTQIGTGITFPGYTITTDNTNVDIKLVVTSSLGCLPDETSHVFATRQTIAASFTQDKMSGCGPLTVNFNNTSTTLTGVSFEWLVDGVVVSTAPQIGSYVFNEDPTGADKIYSVLLRVTTSCGSDDSPVTEITVKSVPRPGLTPDKTFGCSPFDVNFTNTSPGKGNNTYLIDFGDGSTPSTWAYGTPITHRYLNTTAEPLEFTVKMTATNECGAIETTVGVIRVLPNTVNAQFFVDGNSLKVCVGQDVVFKNNSTGATLYEYDFKDGTAFSVRKTSFDTQVHRFMAPGTYVVQLRASNECPSFDIKTVSIEVQDTPTAEFSADVTSGCDGLVVKFTNRSTGGNTYIWDFGDGSPTSNEVNPSHTYTGSARSFKVTLTAMNSLNCGNTNEKPNYITIIGPPRAAFAVSPAVVISIPDYTFKFTNESTNNPLTYRWSFGDGDISTQQDPTHIYADTGRYLVTLRAYNAQGCVDSIQRYVQIVGVPGYTFVPNSFIPGSESVQLQKFTAVGSGMKSWKMQIFNKWGQVLWETTKLDDGKPVEGWDGTYKGVPQPQGIYFWKIDVELINGSEWKGMSLGGAPPRRTGQIYLIR
jgi:PKD repeat protein